MKSMWLLVVALMAGAVSAQAQPTREAALAAMKKATTFMVETVSLRGGYVWTVSDDLTQRWGEVPARPSQVWVQAGTPMVGMALLDAYEATKDPYYLAGARRAAEVLVFGQHPLGGWHYFIDFDPAGLPEWYAQKASQFLYGYEEYRHYYGNATYDDRVTSDAARFLLRFYTTTLDAAFKAPVIKALDFVLMSQYPNGAWPQRYPLRTEYAHDGLPDYTSFYTLNDGVMIGNVELMLEVHRTLGDDRYFESARRAADFLIAVQGPAGEAAWAEQYGFDMRPTPARTHEPAGYVIRESVDAVHVLEAMYLLTGDRRYLSPVPGGLAWFERVNREAIELKRPLARYWEPGTNKPVYVVRSPNRTSEGYGVNTWTTTAPAGADVRPAVDLAPLRQEYEAIAAVTGADARAKYATEHPLGERPARPRAGESDVAAIIAALDARGAWVVDNAMVHHPVASGKHSGDTAPVRGISTAVFVRNLRALAAFVSGGTQ